jgi:iron complex transport system ATP-binding protein
MLEIQDLCCGYGPLDVVKGVSLQALRGEFLCIVGPNGCGKTTLLRAIARIIPSRGRLALDGLDLYTLKRRELACKAAFLAQSSQLYFPYTVYDAVALGRYAHSSSSGLSAVDKAAIEEALAQMGLSDERNRLITELSGGQLQRVYLARTLAQDPEVILLDEPTNHLDINHQIGLLRYLLSWAAEKNRIIIGVLHDLNLARHFGSHMVVMNQGRIASDGRRFDADTLASVYGMDVQHFMQESFALWK